MNVSANVSAAKRCAKGQRGEAPLSVKLATAESHYLINFQTQISTINRRVRCRED